MSSEQIIDQFEKSDDEILHLCWSVAFSVPKFLSRISFAFILKRLAIAVPTLLVVITVAFFMMRAAPGAALQHGS